MAAGGGLGLVPRVLCFFLHPPASSTGTHHHHQHLHHHHHHHYQEQQHSSSTAAAAATAATAAAPNNPGSPTVLTLSSRPLASRVCLPARPCGLSIGIAAAGGRHLATALEGALEAGLRTTRCCSLVYSAVLYAVSLRALHMVPTAACSVIHSPCRACLPVGLPACLLACLPICYRPCMYIPQPTLARLFPPSCLLAVQHCVVCHPAGQPARQSARPSVCLSVSQSVSPSLCPVTLAHHSSCGRCSQERAPLFLGRRYWTPSPPPPSSPPPRPGRPKRSLPSLPRISNLGTGFNASST